MDQYLMDVIIIKTNSEYADIVYVIIVYTRYLNVDG